MHELLRQYAEGRLRAEPEAATQAYQAYESFYMSFLEERFTQMLGGGQVAAAAEIAAEIENARAAWQQTLERGDARTLRTTACTLAIYYNFRGLYLEGQALLEAAAGRLRRYPPSPQVQRALALVLSYQGWAAIRVGALAQAREAFDESQALYTRLDAPPEPGQATDPLLGLGILALVEGNYAEADRLGEAARRRSEAHQHYHNLPYALYVLTSAALAQGRLEAARRYAQQAYAAAQASRDHWFLAYCLNELGNLACALGTYNDARQHYAASYALREEFQDLQGMAIALALLGKVALLQGVYPDARQQYQRSLAIYRQTGDRGGLAAALHGLGLAECALGTYAAARDVLSEALKIAVDMGYTPLVLTIVTGAGELLLRAGQPQAAAELPLVVLRHPAADRDTREQAQRLLARIEAALTPASFAVAEREAHSSELDAVVARLEATLSSVEFGLRDAELAVEQTPAHNTPSAPPEPLVEPLTEREREILQLIAAGLSNQAIATRLMLSLGTVKWYSGQIYGKLAVQTRTQAIARAHELRLLA
jgi:ATP/maltotriose-dependent transcriptional regulator MalT